MKINFEEKANFVWDALKHAMKEKQAQCNNGHPELLKWKTKKKQKKTHKIKKTTKKTKKQINNP